MKKSVSYIIVAIFLLITGCGGKSDNNSANTNIPEGFSEDVYHTLVEEYETYEQIIEENGSLVDEKNERIDETSDGQQLNLQPYSEHFFEDSKARDEGNTEDIVLSEAETKTLDLFIGLNVLSNAPTLEDDETRKMLEYNNGDPKSIEQQQIEAEQDIIDILELDKESISLAMQDSNTSSESASEGSTNEENSNANDENASSYEPEYMPQEEWEACVSSEAYSEEECIEADQYYANGDGEQESEESESQTSSEGTEDTSPASIQEERCFEYQNESDSYKVALSAAQQEIERVWQSYDENYTNFVHPSFEDEEVLVTEQTFPNGQYGYYISSSVDFEHEADDFQYSKTYTLTMTPDFQYLDVSAEGRDSHSLHGYYEPCL